MERHWHVMQTPLGIVCMTAQMSGCAELRQRVQARELAHRLFVINISTAVGLSAQHS